MGKPEHEIEVFVEFAKAAGIGVDKGSVNAEPPPMPDISCRVDGETRYFELTRVADQKMAKKIGDLASGKSVPRVSSYSDKADVVAAIERKAEKTYPIKGQSLELLLYTDAYHPTVEITFVRDILLEMKNEMTKKWRQVWLFDMRTKELVWPEAKASG